MYSNNKELFCELDPSRPAEDRTVKVTKVRVLVEVLDEVAVLVALAFKAPCGCFPCVLNWYLAPFAREAKLLAAKPCKSSKTLTGQTGSGPKQISESDGMV